MKRIARHDARKYDLTRNYKWVDHRGEKSGRLLCMEWIGRWHGRGWWRCQCDCGAVVIRKWKPGNTTSCGCANREANKKRVFDTLREDGTWRHGLARKITLPDGRGFASMTAAARQLGLSLAAFKNRMAHWPPERWLEPARPRGRGAERHRKAWIRSKRHPRLRAQPWAADNIRGQNRWKREESA